VGFRRNDDLIRGPLIDPNVTENFVLTRGFRLSVLDKHRGRNSKALGKPLDLPRIHFSLAGQHLGDHALAANLRQVGLPQIVLLH